MKTIFLGLLVCALAGCRTIAPQLTVAERARFYLESADESGERVTLPLSGAQISIQPKPVFTEYDVVDVRIAHAELGECLAFQLTAAAAQDLRRLSTANPGKRLVLLLGGVPFGARRMSQPLDQGVLLVFVEVPDAALPALLANLRETSAALHSPAK
jgi:hypothetical protein